LNLSSSGNKYLSEIGLREHDFLRLGVQTLEHFFHEPRFDLHGPARFNQRSYDRFDPGVLRNAKNDHRPLLHVEFVEGCLP
jgi:hypothetical protein